MLFPHFLSHIYTQLYQLFYTTSGALSIIIKNKVVKFINEMFLQHSSIQNISEKNVIMKNVSKYSHTNGGEKLKKIRKA